MTATLVAEMVILAIGSAMNIPVIEEFCLFSGTVLLVEYILELTFFASVLSIDVKRVEVCMVFTSNKEKNTKAIDLIS